MTVYGVLKLNNQSGIAVADERETHFGQRTYDVARKIHRIHQTPSFVGFAGSLANGTEILETSMEKLKDTRDYSIEDALSVLEESYRSIRNKKFQNDVLGRYGLTIDEFKAGKYDDALKQGLINTANDPSAFGVYMVFGGYDNRKDDFIVASIVHPGSADKGFPYLVVGSGTDRADLVIGDELVRLSREARENIPLGTGAMILMKAARSAWRNIGVGGSGQVVYVVGDQYKELDLQDVTLLYNLLYAEERGMLSRDYVDRRFDGVMKGEISAEDVVREVSAKLKPEDIMKVFFLDSLHL